MSLDEQSSEFGDPYVEADRVGREISDSALISSVKAMDVLWVFVSEILIFWIYDEAFEELKPFILIKNSLSEN